MGSFTATTPSTKGANTATKRTGSAPAITHADQIQGASPAVKSIMPGEHDLNLPPLNRYPDPLNSPWLNPTRPPVDFLKPFGGADTPQPGASPGAAPQLTLPPPMPERPAPSPRATPGLAGRTATSGQTPVYAPSEAEGGGNNAESAAYVQRKNAGAAKIARTEAQVERRHDEAREKQRRAEQKAGERAARWHAEEMADAQKDAARRREQLAKTVATRVRQLMEPQGHPGLSDDAGIARAARHADLSAEAAASNDRQVSALGKIRGVGDLPTYTADAAENYGDQGIGEVADLIHRTAKADPEQGKALLEQTTARISAAKAARLKQTVASYQLDDDPEIKAPRSSANSDSSNKALQAIRIRLVADAQKVIGIDNKLIERAGEQAPTVVGLVGVYEILSEEQRSKLLKKIGEIENSDSGRELAAKLRGHIAYKKMLGETTYSTEKLAEYRDEANRLSEGLRDAASLSKRVEIAIPLMLGSLVIGEDAKSFDEKLKSRQGDDH